MLYVQIAKVIVLAPAAAAKSSNHFFTLQEGVYGIQNSAVFLKQIDASVPGFDCALPIQKARDIGPSNHRPIRSWPCTPICVVRSISRQWPHTRAAWVHGLTPIAATRSQNFTSSVLAFVPPCHGSKGSKVPKLSKMWR